MDEVPNEAEWKSTRERLARLEGLVAKKQLFQPFFTTKDAGTGLGLALVERIAEHAGGFITVHSTPGAGSTFAMYLPHT